MLCWTVHDIRSCDSHQSCSASDFRDELTCTRACRLCSCSYWIVQVLLWQVRARSGTGCLKMDNDHSMVDH
jgi:hypothetical protein